MTTVRSEARLQHSLGEISRLLEKHRVLESLTHRQEGPRRDLLESLQQRQNEAELRKRLRVMHAAELAYVLEALPLGDELLLFPFVLLLPKLLSMAEGGSLPIDLEPTFSKLVFPQLKLRVSLS